MCIFIIFINDNHKWQMLHIHEMNVSGLAKKEMIEKLRFLHESYKSDFLKRTVRRNWINFSGTQLFLLFSVASGRLSKFK